MWKLRSNATALTVSSLPGSGMIGCLHTQHLGANFLQIHRFRKLQPQETVSQSNCINLLVEILDTVNLISSIDGECNTV